MPDANPTARVPRFPPHGRALPLRAGTRGSPLALVQTRNFMARLTSFCPALRDPGMLQEQVIKTTGDAVQDRSLAEIGGKGLFAKEIHEALLDRRVDFAVHSLKDLETAMPPGIVLACTLQREDARDALILGPTCLATDPADPFAAVPANGIIGTNSVRRQAQLLYRRPDVQTVLIRGNINTRVAKLQSGAAMGTFLAVAGLMRMGWMDAIPPGIAIAPLDPEVMVPSACQGIVGVTVREDEGALRELLFGIEDPQARAVSTAERALLAALDGSCRTPVGGYARHLPDGQLHLTGLVARPDGSFLLKRSAHGAAADAERLGAELGHSLRADSPADIFA